MTENNTMMHGGDAQALGLNIEAPPAGWMDLSTGIAPFAYPTDRIAPETFQRLPQKQAEEDLLAAAANYFSSPPANWCLGPGSQALLQLLPHMLDSQQVAIFTPTYGEHAYRWAGAGHDVVALRDLDALPDTCRSVVLTHPNNPTGETFDPANLRALADEMTRRSGYLILDEAFADITPELSLAAEAGRPGLIVLRSFGKFFGLAGLRIGFIGGPRELITRIKDHIGPWPVNGPALEIGRRAYGDAAWIAAQRQKLAAAARALDSQLQEIGDIIGGTDLFRLVTCTEGDRVFRNLAERGILVRRFEYQPEWLRFGLPGNEDEAQKFKAAIE